MLVYIEPLSMFPQLHSDTIFGAIAFAISELYPEKIIEDMISEFEKTPPFILSSAFPFIKDGEKKIKFFPKIINKHTSIKDEDINKKYRKVKYIQEDIFLKLASGELSEYELLTNISVKEKENNKKFKIYDNNYLIDIDLNITAKLKDMVIPSNSINRITGETEIFYSEGKFFEKNHVGLFCAVKFYDDKYKKIVKSAFRFLMDRGFGKDVSNGKGQFKCDEIVDKDLCETSGEFFVTLSRFIPNENDLKNIDNSSFYTIGSKRGRSSGNEIRKRIRFFEEGSVFPNYSENYGKLVMSGINSPAVEYGFAFPINYTIKGD